MLYPDFNELVALKNRKLNLKHPSNRAVKSTVSGNHHSPFRGHGLEFDSVREYVLGDDIRSIDWRVTARTGSPHLKILKEERERHIFICVDMHSTMRFGTKNTFKSVQAARVASFLGWLGLSHQDRVSACLFGDVEGGVQFFPPTRTRKSLCEMIRILSIAPTEKHVISMESVLEHTYRVAHTGSLVYVISDFVDLENNFQREASLSRLRKKCDVVFIAVNDPADKFIPSIGTIGFAVNDTDKVYLNTESRAGREAYAADWDKNRKSLYTMTGKLKIPLIELSTESEIRRDLSWSLKNIVKGNKT